MSYYLIHIYALHVSPSLILIQSSDHLFKTIVIFVIVVGINLFEHLSFLLIQVLWALDPLIRPNLFVGLKVFKEIWLLLVGKV